MNLTRSLYASTLEIPKILGWDYADPLDERLVFTFVTWLTVVLSYWGLGGAFLLIEHFNIFERYKIQKGKSPDPVLVKQCARDVLISDLILFPLTYFLYPFFKHFGSSVDPATIPSVWTLLWQLTLLSIVNETLFYWSHRLLHTRWLYGPVHKKHHTFKVPIGIAAAFATPPEEMLSTFLSTIFPTIPLGVHLYTLLLWLAFRVWETIDAHSGYLLPFSPFTILTNNAAHHDFHHSHNVGAYGTFVHFWDYVMATDSDFKRWWNKEGRASFESRPSQPQTPAVPWPSTSGDKGKEQLDPASNDAEAEARLRRPSSLRSPVTQRKSSTAADTENDTSVNQEIEQHISPHEE